VTGREEGFFFLPCLLDEVPRPRFREVSGEARLRAVRSDCPEGFFFLSCPLEGPEEPDRWVESAAGRSRDRFLRAGGGESFNVPVEPFPLGVLGCWEVDLARSALDPE